MSERRSRIYVGGISKSLRDSILDLQNRFEKYGTILTPFDIHYNEIQDKCFGFITMKITDSKLKSLQKVFNGVNFKGSKLIIDVAKPDWKERWERDARRQDTGIKQRQLRQKITSSRMNRINERNMNPFKLALVLKGRMRASKRKDLKNLTIRVEIKGRVRIVKCKKSKLWGIAKNRSIKDLTTRFVAGEWIDGNEHVIDRFSQKVIIFDDSGIKVQDYEDEEPVQNEITEEHDQTNKVLEGLLSKYNFDKPVALDEEKEDTAGSDYEFQKHSDNEDYNDDDEEEVVDIKYQVPEKDCIQPSQESIVKQYLAQNPDLLEKPLLPTPHDEEEEEDDDDEFYKNLTVKYANEDGEDFDIVSSATAAAITEAVPVSPNEFEVPDDEVDVDSASDSDSGSVKDGNGDGDQDEHMDIDNDDEDHDTEFLPTFGTAEGKEAEDKEEEKEEEDGNDDEEEEEFIPTFGTSEPFGSNTTEALRALLNPIDVKSVLKEEEAPINIPIPEIQHKRSLGLFFTHFDSPFLVAQSQINKFTDPNIRDDLDWDKWFWDNRGELNREFRRRRRDVLKKNRKGQSKSLVI